MRNSPLNKLRNRGIYGRYFFNSPTAANEIINFYDKFGYVEDDICETIIDVSPEFLEELNTVVHYYPKELKTHKYITDSVVLAIIEKYRETIDILIEIRESYDDPNNQYQPKIFENPRNRLRNAARTRTTRKGLKFHLTSEDIILVRRCPILNKPINYYNNVCSLDSPSLDRIDNNKGYTKDNIQVISMQANNMKASATPEQIITFSKNILKLYGTN